jgi:hypothetical protein
MLYDVCCLSNNKDYVSQLIHFTGLHFPFVSLVLSYFHYKKENTSHFTSLPAHLMDIFMRLYVVVMLSFVGRGLLWAYPHYGVLTVSFTGLEIREYGRRYPSCWPSGIRYAQKLALTSPTNGCRLVGIVRSRTQAAEFSFFSFSQFPLRSVVADVND